MKFEPLIFNELKKYVSEDILRFDVPGHKGNYLDNDFVRFFGENIIKADVNSMKRLDNLNYSETIIKQSQLNIAKLHCAKEARFLINGTTIGIQIMILSSIKQGEKILVPKNIHKSIQSALILSGGIPVYLDVDFDNNLGIYTKLQIQEIENKLQKHKNIKACLLINPSYYGFKYEFLDIVKYLKGKNIIVLVDEAHGGHLYLQDNEITGIKAGADMTSISYHKTLGTLTQTSLLLYNSDKVDIKMVDKAFSMLTSTSPSYLFMCNLEVTILDLFYNKKQLFVKTINELEKFKTRLNKIDGIEVLNNEYFNIEEKDFDKLRLVISVEKLSLSGFEVYDILCDKYDIQTELGEFNIILLVITIFDDFERFDRLYSALEQIAKKNKGQKKFNMNILKSEQKKFVSPRDLFYAELELINYKQSLGRTIGESLMLYPPGIPLIIQGEIITEQLKDYITYLLEQKEKIYGLYDEKIYVLKN